MLERLVVSIVFVKAEGSGNTFEIDLASEPGRGLIKTKSNMIALNIEHRTVYINGQLNDFEEDRKYQGFRFSPSTPFDENGLDNLKSVNTHHYNKW